MPKYIWPKWNELTDRQKARIANGIGAAWWPKRVRAKVTAFAVSFFPNAQWNQHDYEYFRGGNELQRWAADFRFFMGMVDDLRNLPWYKDVFGAVLAIVFYLMVMLLGSFAFSYGKRTPPRFIKV